MGIIATFCIVVTFIQVDMNYFPRKFSKVQFILQSWL